MVLPQMHHQQAEVDRTGQLSKDQFKIAVSGRGADGIGNQHRRGGRRLDRQVAIGMRELGFILELYD
jgi:hypothetical protein